MRSMSGLYFFCMIGLFIFVAKLLHFAVGGDNIYISYTIAALTTGYTLCEKYIKYV